MRNDEVFVCGFGGWLVIFGLAALLCFILGAAKAEEPSYSKSFLKAKQTGKKLLVVFTTTQCFYCEKQKEAMKNDPEVKYISDQHEILFIKILRGKKNSDEIQKLIDLYSVNLYPTTLQIDPQTRETKVLRGWAKSRFSKFD